MLNKNDMLNALASLEPDLKHAKRITIGPLRAHEGTALAQLFRQLLAHSVRGSAISGVRIEGVLHAFSVVPNVKEELYQIISQLKQVVLKRLKNDEPAMIKLEKEGPGVVYAGDFKSDNVEIVNPDLVICTISEAATLRMDCFVTSGLSYIAEEEINRMHAQQGMLLFGTSYCPVKNVSYEVRPLKAGHNSHLEELLLTVETNGSITALEAMQEAAGRLGYVLKPFLQNEPEKDLADSGEKKKFAFNTILLSPVNVLDLSVRAQGCIKHYGIKYLGELVIMTEEKLLSVPSIGQVSIDEISNKLAKLGLSLNMIVSGWPTGDELAKAVQDYVKE